MNTWICRKAEVPVTESAGGYLARYHPALDIRTAALRALIAAAGCAALMGCAALGPGDSRTGESEASGVGTSGTETGQSGVGKLFAGLTTPAAGRPAPNSIAVARGEIVIAGPPGYCIDRRGSQLAGDAAFVLLASCATITPTKGVAGPHSAGLLTASVDKTTGPPPSLAELEAFLTSDAGRGAMARDKNPSSVTVLETHTEQGALMLRIADSSDANPEALQGTYWRALFSLSGRLITVTVQGFEKNPLSDADGHDKLRGFLQRIRGETLAKNAADVRSAASKSTPGAPRGLLANLRR